MTRTCASCPTSLEGRHGSAVYCAACKKQREQRRLAKLRDDDAQGPDLPADIIESMLARLSKRKQVSL